MCRVGRRAEETPVVERGQGFTSFSYLGVDLKSPVLILRNPEINVFVALTGYDKNTARPVLPGNGQSSLNEQ